MTSLPVAGFARYEHFFRAAAGLDLDKADLERYSDFISKKIRDLHFRAVATASAMGARSSALRPPDHKGPAGADARVWAPRHGGRTQSGTCRT